MRKFVMFAVTVATLVMMSGCGDTTLCSREEVKKDTKELVWNYMAKALTMGSVSNYTQLLEAKVACDTGKNTHKSYCDIINKLNKIHQTHLLKDVITQRDNGKVAECKAFYTTNVPGAQTLTVDYRVLITDGGDHYYLELLSVE